MKSKNPKCIILCGPPGAGKTHWALNFLQRNKYESYIRLSRDDFRRMFKNVPQCEPNIEGLISDVLQAAAIKALVKRQNVIVDNTHLKASHINEFVSAIEEYADVEYMVFDISLKKCIENDKNRENSIGEDLVREMYKDYEVLRDSFVFQNKTKINKVFTPKPFIEGLPTAVIFDIDGTLAEKGDRHPFEWNKVDRDAYIDVVGEQARFHRSEGREIIVFSGRDSVCRGLTKEWLDFYNFEYDQLWMRAEEDYRKDTVIKEELYQEHINGKYNVLCVYDDRLSVVDMWYQLGLYVFNCNQGQRQF
jgi:predicted kinase